MDPLTISAAISTATAAFGGIKKAFMAGRELDAMTKICHVGWGQSQTLQI